jgi:hypothetical protein
MVCFHPSLSSMICSFENNYREVPAGLVTPAPSTMLPRFWRSSVKGWAARGLGAKAIGLARGNRTADCQKILDAVRANAAFAVRADSSGRVTFSAIPPGTYYLMISTRYNNQPLVWSQPIQVVSASNSVTLDQRNATQRLLTDASRNTVNHQD